MEDLTPIGDIENEYNTEAESLNTDLNKLHEYSNRKIAGTTTFLKNLKFQIKDKHDSLLKKRSVLDNYYSKKNGNNTSKDGD